SLRPMALVAEHDRQGPISRAVQRPPLVRELEPDARQESAVGRQAARAQRADDARHVWHLDRRLHAGGHRGDPPGHGGEAVTADGAVRATIGVRSPRIPSAHPAYWHWIGTGAT